MLPWSWASSRWLEVGVKFQTGTPGAATGIRFSKAAANTGIHIGDLWTASGQLLASATFTGETASGWQRVSFARPVALNPNTTYVASYFAPSGHYSQDGAYFCTVPEIGAPANSVDRPPAACAAEHQRHRQRRLHPLQQPRLPGQLRRCIQLLGRCRVLPGLIARVIRARGSSGRGPH